MFECGHAYNIAMPFVSESQRRYFHVMQAQGKISPETVKEWEDATPKKKKKALPYHVKKESAELEKLAAAVRGKLVGKANASARQYSLREGDDGKMTCTCGDYKFRQAGVNGECKHIKAHKGKGTPFLRESVKAAASTDTLLAGARRLGAVRTPARLQGNSRLSGPVTMPTTGQITNRAGWLGGTDTATARKLVAQNPAALPPKNTQGKIFMPKGNVALPGSAGISGEGRRAVNGMTALHEGFERSVRPADSTMFTTHLSPDVMLQEHNMVSRATGPGAPEARNVFKQMREGSGEAPALNEIFREFYGAKMPFQYGEGAKIPKAMRKDFVRRWKTREDAVKQGAEAALAKYAIEFKSPKMRGVLQGAMDKAYQLGASPRTLPHKDPGFLRYVRDLPAAQIPPKVRMSANPDNHERIEGALMTSTLDGLRVRQARISSGNIPTTPRELATSIGRPRENAIRGMLKRKPANLSAIDEAAEGGETRLWRNVTREPGVGPRANSPQTKFRDLLEDIHTTRSSGAPVEGILGDDGYRPRVNKKLLAQHTPDILQGMLAKKKGAP